MVCELSLLNGFGKGKYADYNADVAGVKYELHAGDQQVVQFEYEGGGVETLSFYSMLRKLEASGKVDCKVTQKHGSAIACCKCIAQVGPCHACPLACEQWT